MLSPEGKYQTSPIEPKNLFIHPKKRAEFSFGQNLEPSPVLGRVSWLNGFVAYPITIGDCSQPPSDQGAWKNKKLSHPKAATWVTKPQVAAQRIHPRAAQLQL